MFSNFIKFNDGINELFLCCAGVILAGYTSYIFLFLLSIFPLFPFILANRRKLFFFALIYLKAIIAASCLHRPQNRYAKMQSYIFQKLVH